MRSQEQSAAPDVVRGQALRSCTVDVVSLGFRTDLALLRLGGTEVSDHGDHLVVRTASNPSYRWGNFLLLQRPPTADEVDHWLERFGEEFPAADHLTMGVDGSDGTAADLAPLAARGLQPDVASVMTAASVHPPPRPNTTAVYRQLQSDDDWAQSVALAEACNDKDPPGPFRTFVTRRTATNRALVEDGHGAWFGAFVDGRLLSQMGLLAASPGLARFQTVETHPDARGRGLAGCLVHHVSTYGFTELNAETLVMVADPDYLAIRVYRSVGFESTQTQLMCERPPDSDRPEPESVRSTAEEPTGP